MSAVVTSVQPSFTNQLDPGTSIEHLSRDEDGSVKLPTWKQLKTKVTTREGWLGAYDWSLMCMPQLPCGKRRKSIRSAPFYALEAPMPIALAMLCGVQHALAMLAGLIAVPIILSSQLGFDSATQNQLVATSLIASGILSINQMTRWRIPFTKKYYVGTGLITVVGTSFATLTTASAIFNLLYADGTCPSEMIDGAMVRQACSDAYGYLLGTSCLCSLFLMALAFIPPLQLKRLFPPIVTGPVILMIGSSLIGESGVLNWGGGSNGCHARPATGPLALCPGPNALPWGDPRYLGLGFLAFVTIIIIEHFGSPALKSASIVAGLAVGCIVAGPLGYISADSIKSAPAITFLWRETFKLRIHGPSVLPFLTIYLVIALEASGDITASSEASRQPVRGPLFDSRIQGGLLADGLNGCFSALFMNPPLSIFAQNNGVISLTRVANRQAGYFSSIFLIILGILAKISGVFLAIPNPVLGGVTTFLFASVATSGLKVISLCKFTRRDRVVLASALTFGIGNLQVSDWWQYLFTYSGSNSALKGFLSAITIVLSTPYCIVALVGALLNATLPPDADEVVDSRAPGEEKTSVVRDSEEADDDNK